jgi:hypothetical protein
MAAGLAVSDICKEDNDRMMVIYALMLFSADEFLYQNQWGEIALLNVGNLSEKILMSNTTYVSTNKPTMFTFFLSPRSN